MKKTFVLLGVVFFIAGSALILSAHTIFNRFSVATFATLRWGDSKSFPEKPFELAKGDQVSINLSISTTIPNELVIVRLLGTLGREITFGGFDYNTTIYYYVQTDDLYFCNVWFRSAPYGSASINATLNIEVIKNTPNFFFLLGGGIVLLAGIITIPIAVFYPSKNGKTVSIPPLSH